MSDKVAATYHPNTSAEGLEPLHSATGYWEGGMPRTRAVDGFLDCPKPNDIEDPSIDDRLQSAITAYLRSMALNGYTLQLTPKKV